MVHELTQPAAGDVDGRSNEARGGAAGGRRRSGTRSRLDELAGRITAVHAAVAEHDVAAKTARRCGAAADLQERERNLPSRGAFAQGTTQLSREPRHVNREAVLTAREQALDGPEALDSARKGWRPAEQWRAALA